jgi:hypothetical protein
MIPIITKEQFKEVYDQGFEPTLLRKQNLDVLDYLIKTFEPNAQNINLLPVELL